MLTIDGGTGEVIVGEVPLVPPQINEDFETILGWADELRRLKVRANADTPADAAKAREFGAEGIGLCRTEHMFMAEDRLPVVREMILAGGEDERRVALDKLLPHQQADFEGIFEAMAGLPVTIRLLDPPLHEFLPPLDEAKDERMRERIKALHETNPMLGTRGCRLGLLWPEIYEMQVRAIIRAAVAVEERTGDAPLVEIMHPLVGFAEELHRLRSITVATANEESETVEYLVGTMIELPRACIRADEIAAYADFFSFGTNDLTQTTLGLSRDDAEGKFLTRYLEDGVLERNPFETIDQGGVGDLMRIAVERGRGVKEDIKLGICGEHGGEPESVAFCHRPGARLRQLLAVPGAAGPAGRGAGRAERVGRRSRRRRRVAASILPRRGSGKAGNDEAGCNIRGDRLCRAARRRLRRRGRRASPRKATSTSRPRRPARARRSPRRRICRRASRRSRRKVTYTKQETKGPTTIVEGYFNGDIREAHDEWKKELEASGYKILFDELEDHDSEVSWQGEGRSGQVALREECGSADKIYVHITNRPA